MGPPGNDGQPGQPGGPGTPGPQGTKRRTRTARKPRKPWTPRKPRKPCWTWKPRCLPSVLRCRRRYLLRRRNSPLIWAIPTVIKLVVAHFHRHLH
ncbi:hypothetical protein OESDEN_22809 [Oesophagostomum dentatum]|uniref:Collagen triple helix repeat protein n=1 Tax=Oesophagostomum dentatum TaxID=61180 RepID=A0A0B1S0Z8_OESDE|nr:hypothetical protein OESDEN_22809 [Oesophagostomum dentatum]